MSADDPKRTSHAAMSEAKRKLLEERLKGVRGSVKKDGSGLGQRPPQTPRLASVGQQRIWLLHELDPDSPNYNITSSFILEGRKLEVATLEESINHVIARHEVLRSNFKLVDGELLQLVKDKLEVEISVLETKAGTSPAEVLNPFTRIVFDLGKDPLIRVYHAHAQGGDSALMMVVHDILFDKWSLGVFWKEVGECYRALLAGRSANLPVLDIQYSDFSYWQRKWLDSNEIQKQLAFWTEYLANPPAPLIMPTDRPYPARLTDAGKLERWKLSTEVTRKLKIFAASENTSLFTVLLYGFNLLLHLYSGEEDILVGAPVANRRHKECAHLVGFFLSTICIRSRLAGNPSLLDAFREMRDQSMEAVRNQDIPLDKIVDALKPARVEGRHPLFQTLFVYQREDEAAPPLDLGETSTRHTFIETHCSKFDLTLFVADAGEDMDTILEYRTDLFDSETMHRMLCHYEVVLAGFLDSPKQQLSQLEFLTEQERACITDDWQGKKISFLQEPLLHELIVEKANGSPQATAVIGNGESLTYRQLEEESRKLAGVLLESLQNNDQTVGLFMNRSPDAIVALLSILRAGFAYVPIDPNYPVDRCRHIIEDSGIKCILTTSRFCDQLPSVDGLNVICPSDLNEHEAGEKALPTVKPQSPAYIIYTSGSTGKPKGVVVSHDNLRHSTLAREHVYPDSPGRFLLIPSLSFDSSIAGIFWTLTTGGTLVLPSSDQLRDPSKLMGLITAENVRSLLCVPSLYRELLLTEWASPNPLRLVILAGEVLPANLIKDFFLKNRQCRLYNEYGPTEGTVWASVHACVPADAENGVAIGKPIPNATVYVMDGRGRLLPPEIPGELFIGGSGVAIGYFNQLELTEDRFIDDIELGRLYRSGDIGYFDLEGNLHFCGRKDMQVKVRGYRIEPGEIETALRKHPTVSDAVVYTLPAMPGNLEDLMAAVSAEVLDSLVRKIEELSPQEVKQKLIADEVPEADDGIAAIRKLEKPGFRFGLEIKDSGFIQPPRKAQRDWLLSQAIAEFSDDLEYLDDVSSRFVPGYDHQMQRDVKDITQAKLAKDEIMEDWQVPVMKSMADYVTEAHGDVLEIGFGRGVSAEFIQQRGVKSHTIVEMNDHSVKEHFIPWRNTHKDRDIRLVHSRWQDAEKELGKFDGIFFHAFPMNEEEFIDYVLKSVTFAEHAFPSMAAHLREGGVFTYLTTEIDSLSRRHQRLLFKYFTAISFHVLPLTIPEDTHDTWWAPSMVILKATK